MMGVIIVIVILLVFSLMILVLKMTKKYTHNMILMSRYKGHGGKRANKFGQDPPPHFGQCSKENIFLREVFLMAEKDKIKIG